MAKKNSYERQTQIQSELLRTARLGQTHERLIDKLMNEKKKKPVQKEPTVYLNGVGYNLTPEQLAEIVAKNEEKWATEAERKKEAKRIKAEKRKAEKAALEAEGTAEERALKALIKAKAQAQIMARSKNKNS